MAMKPQKIIKRDKMNSSKILHLEILKIQQKNLFKKERGNLINKINNKIIKKIQILKSF